MEIISAINDSHSIIGLQSRGKIETSLKTQNTDFQLVVLRDRFI